MAKRKLISQKTKKFEKSGEFSSKKYGENWNKIDIGIVSKLLVIPTNMLTVMFA